MSVPVIETYTEQDDGAATTSTTITKPSGVATDDYLFIAVGDDVSNPGSAAYGATSSSGDFTRRGQDGSNASDVCIATYDRVADETEGATETIQWTHGTANGASGYYFRISGADVGGTPLNQHGSFNVDPSAATHTAWEVTTTVAECLGISLIAHDGKDGASYGVSGTGWSLGDEVTGGGAGNTGFAFATKSITSAGASVDCVFTPAVSDGAVCVQVAVAPATGAVLTRDQVDVPRGIGRGIGRGLAMMRSRSGLYVLDRRILVPVGIQLMAA